MKTEKPDEEQKAYVQVNPLDSSKSLESKKRSKKADSGKESPVLKSLFDVKENQQYKQPSAGKCSSEKKQVSTDGPFKEPVNPFAKEAASISFKSGSD